MFFAIIATALPIYFFMTPMFLTSPADNPVLFAVAALVSVAVLVMSYAEVASKILAGLKGKKKWSPESLSALATQASTSAIFHINAAYAVRLLIVHQEVMSMTRCACFSDSCQFTCALLVTTLWTVRNDNFIRFCCWHCRCGAYYCQISSLKYYNFVL